MGFPATRPQGALIPAPAACRDDDPIVSLRNLAAMITGIRSQAATLAAENDTPGMVYADDIVTFMLMIARKSQQTPGTILPDSFGSLLKQLDAGGQRHRIGLHRVEHVLSGAAQAIGSRLIELEAERETVEMTAQQWLITTLDRYKGYSLYRGKLSDNVAFEAMIGHQWPSGTASGLIDTREFIDDVIALLRLRGHLDHPDARQTIASLRSRSASEVTLSEAREILVGLSA